jgi:hypothetical protein
MLLVLGPHILCATLPVSGPTNPVPLGYDVIAAVAATARFSRCRGGWCRSRSWSASWPIPRIGYNGALRRQSRGSGARRLSGGRIIVTPIADLLRMPFAAFAFASVVSLIPGVLLLRMAGGFVELVALGGKASNDLLLNTFANGATAMLVILTMTLGLILPKVCIDYLRGRAIGALFDIRKPAAC